MQHTPQSLPSVNVQVPPPIYSALQYVVQQWKSSLPPIQGMPPWLIRDSVAFHSALSSTDSLICLQSRIFQLAFDWSTFYTEHTSLIPKRGRVRLLKRHINTRAHTGSHKETLILASAVQLIFTFGLFNSPHATDNRHWQQQVGLAGLAIGRWNSPMSFPFHGPMRVKSCQSSRHRFQLVITCRNRMSLISSENFPIFAASDPVLFFCLLRVNFENHE